MKDSEILRQLIVLGFGNDPKGITVTLQEALGLYTDTLKREVLYEEN